MVYSRPKSDTSRMSKNLNDNDDEGDNRPGLGICIGSGFTEVSIDQMTKHMEEAKVLEGAGKTYGLGKPRFYLIDEECY